MKVVNLNPFLPLPTCYDEFTPNPITDVISCYDLHRKIIALRVYFTLIIINFFFIVLTTAYFIYRNLTAKWYTPIQHTESISKMWQIYSLKKRSLFGSVLGAIGHLVFSTTVLLYQVFVSSYTCDIYLFGPLTGFYIWTYALVWRTVRLHQMIRINQFQQRFLTNDCPAEQSEDYIWFQKHKDRLNTSTRVNILIFLSTLSLIMIVILLAETCGLRRHGDSTCIFDYGNYVILSLVIFFFVVVVPFLFLYLRHDEDTHGIRREIWITISVGVPCFLVFVIWQVLFESPTTAKPAGTRGIFGPANWIVIVTTANHVMTVILPVFKRLSFKRHLELTTESLEHALHDPRQRRLLQEWAVKDFSVENILFYEKYLELAERHGPHRPFEQSDLDDLVDFYNTFIKEQAPLQVNISYAARKEIDDVLGPLAGFRQEDTTSLGIPFFLQEKIITTPTPKSHKLEFSEKVKMPSVSLELFEQARQEIFWDIFSGLFPKVVAASHS